MEDVGKFARPSPHADALFSLVPINDRAATVLDHPFNRHLVSLVSDPTDQGRLRHGLNIGPHIGSQSAYTLATLGRSGADITLEGANISRIQCSFEVHETSGAIMLQDRSSAQSTQLLGETAIPFELGRSPRRVVITPKINQKFGFGGVGCDVFKFRIVWHEDELKVESILHHRVENPRHVRTVTDDPTVLPSQRLTRIHTGGGNQARKIRWTKKEELGRGSYGEVWSALNVDSGDAFAVKIVKGPALMSQNHLFLKREVETLARISHPNVLEYIAAQSSEDSQLEIITKLKVGNVQELIRLDVFVKNHSMGRPLLRDMLQALDYLTSEGILHRDVKPANILYTPLPDGSYKFQLADFGLCNVIVDARTCAGSGLFMAPELENNLALPQTPKVDIWSLFVTLAYAMNARGFRDKPVHTLPLRIAAVEEAASDPGFQPIREMAFVDPDQRASAADMLEKHFNGEGRSTPRNQLGNAATANDRQRRKGDTTEEHRCNMIIPPPEKPVTKAQKSRMSRPVRAFETSRPALVRPDEKRRRTLGRGITKEIG